LQLQQQQHEQQQQGAAAAIKENPFDLDNLVIFIG